MCIRADDRDRLLNTSKWPNLIVISEWYFKSLPQATNGRRRRLAGKDDEVTVACAATAGCGQSFSAAAAISPVARLHILRKACLVY